MAPRFFRTLLALAFVCAGRALAQGEAAMPAPTPVPTPTRSENVVVQAIRGEEEAPVTKTDLDRLALVERTWGQELPVLLQDTPSVTQYSETGSGQGYAYFTLRGLSQTRVNMTFDGVPLNEPEDSAVYTADFGNLGLNLASVQVQRGVGTSTFGAAAFAGSVNLESLDATRAPGLTGSLGGGSFGTAFASANWNSGTFGGGWRLSLRPSWQTTDGFRESSGVQQDSLFFTAVRDFEQSSLRISGFVGEERIQQAFLAVEPRVLERNLAYNPMSSDERDHFHEYLVNAQWTLALGDDASLSLQPYAVGAGGWYRLYADAERTNLQEYGLSWLFGGGIATFTQKLGAFRMTLGANANTYKSAHSLNDGDGARLYTNHGTKGEFSGFMKLLGDLGRWHPFVDAQVRHARFGYEGSVGDTATSWTFFNPKAGVRLDLAPRASAYLSVGRTEREPGRSDLLYGADNAPSLPDLTAVKPERVWDVELGAEWRTRTLALKVDLYDMEFRNEIAATGEISAIGLPLRRNVDESYRRGIELEASWQALEALRLSTSINASRNRISSWTQFYDVYDASGDYAGSTSRTYHDVVPVATPPFIATLGAETTALKGLTAGMTGRYVAASWLDNTNAEGLEAPRTFQLDATLVMDLARWIPAGKPRLKVQVNNVLDNRRLWPRGYSYLYANRDAAGADTLAGIPYYYPLATRSVHVSLDMGF
ncbi:MAG: TonB-dependent receptor [Acidobacteriota bacterium]|nr:TonB-dependent receptor [Acidobacteriota bacterium]